jgi:hypothetical protein
MVESSVAATRRPATIFTGNLPTEATRSSASGGASVSCARTDEAGNPLTTSKVNTPQATPGVRSRPITVMGGNELFFMVRCGSRDKY